jgi:dTDP-glucose pyrophosphorylase
MTSSWCTGPDNTYVGGQPTRSGQFHWHVAKAPRGLMVACPEKIAFHQGWINAEALQKHAQSLDKNGYGQYLVNLLK